MNKSESRYFRTAAKMGDALLALMEQKEFEAISIREICAQAQVHRSTFYLHYENTVDLLEETIGRLLTDFREHFAAVEGLPTDRFITDDFLLPFLAYVRGHRRVWRTVLRHPERFRTDKLYDQLMQRLFDPILASYGYPVHERDYVMRFYLTGINALMVCWLERNCEESDGEMCRIIRDCILGKDRA